MAEISLPAEYLLSSQKRPGILVCTQTLIGGSLRQYDVPFEPGCLEYRKMKRGLLCSMFYRACRTIFM
jgi:hypothetical protein